MSLSDRFLKIFTERLKNKMGNFVVDRIRSFSRTGKSIARKNPEDFKKLSESYIHMRFGLVHFRTIRGKVRPIMGPDPRLDYVDRDFFEPDFSNLTFSGQLLKSLRYRLVNRPEGFAIAIDAVGTRKRLPGEKRALTNEKVAKFVQDQGRPFIGIDGNGRKRIKRMIIDEIRRKKLALR